MQPWQELSTDPNDPQIMERRKVALSGAMSTRLIDDRVAYLCACVAGKSLLDIGVVEHSIEAAQSDRWLHGNLRKHAASCLGVDVLESAVKALQSRGYDVLLADVTREPLPRKFDVIVGGEVLEHIDAPGAFMKNCATMLNPGGKLIITVPNPWFINAVIKSGTSKQPFVDSADHVAWYDASTLYELGQRYGLLLSRYSGIATNGGPRSLGAKVLFGLQPMWIALGASPLMFSKSIIFEFTTADQAA